MRFRLFAVSLVSCFLFSASCGSPRPEPHLTITFKGILMNGRKYSQPFGRIFRFELVPEKTGWRIRIADISGKQDLTGPGTSEKILIITADQFPDSMPEAFWAGRPPFAREFTFSPPGFPEPSEPGGGLFRILDYGFAKGKKNLKWVQFECVLTWEEWDKTASGK